MKIDSLPPPAGPEAEVSDWLEEPAAEAAPAEPFADLGLDDEPMAAEAAAEAAPPEEIDALPPPAAEEEADVFGWLDEPLTSDSQAEAEPPSNVEFGEEAVAAEPIVEDAEPEAFAPLAPPEAAPDDDFMKLFDEPEPRAAHSEVESLESMSFRRRTGAGVPAGRPWHG